MSAYVMSRRLGGFGGSYGVAAGGVRFTSGDSTQPTGLLEILDGVAAGQCDQAFVKAFSIAGGGSLAIDLKGGGGELDLANRPLALAKLRWLFLEITGPAAGKELRVGPQGAANAFQGWWPGVTAADKTPVRYQFEQADPQDGWAVGASTKILTISNPGGAAVAGFLCLAGTTS